MLEQDTQSNIDKSVSSIKESLKSAIAGPLAIVTEKLASVLEAMAKNPVIKTMLGIAGGAAAVLAGAVAGGMAINAIKNAIVGPRGSKSRPMYVTSTDGGGGIADALSGGDDSGGTNSGGGLGSSLKRGMTAFRKGGLKGGLKSIGRMAKSGIGGLAKGGLKGIGKGLLKKIPYLGALLGAGIEISEGGFNVESLSRAALSGGGAFLGGLAGSAVAPGVGTVAGGIGGGMAGDWLGDKIFGERKEKPEEVDDFIMRPGQRPIKFRKDDIIMGGTSLAGNSTGGNVEGLLRELIEAVKQGGNIYIGPNKLNEAIGLNLHPMR
jgi:uncharacterized protein YcfJ